MSIHVPILSTDGPPESVVVGTGVRLLEIGHYIRVNGGLWSRDEFVDLCRRFKVPTVQLKGGTYIDPWVFEQAWVVATRLGGEDVDAERDELPPQEREGREATVLELMKRKEYHRESRDRWQTLMGRKGGKAKKWNPTG